MSPPFKKLRYYMSAICHSGEQHAHDALVSGMASLRKLGVSAYGVNAGSLQLSHSLSSPALSPPSPHPRLYVPHALTGNKCRSPIESKWSPDTPLQQPEPTVGDKWALPRGTTAQGACLESGCVGWKGRKRGEGGRKSFDELIRQLLLSIAALL